MASSQQLLTPEIFYAQRDSRFGSYPIAQLAPRRTAIVVPPDAKHSLGVELALFWTASIIRRMGRPFAELILVSSDEFRFAESYSAAGVTVEQLISAELMGADPFAPVQWRVWAKKMDLSDAAAVIWLGSPPLGVGHDRTLVINACGWISVIYEPFINELSLSPPDFDAAPAAIVFAACLAAARVFSSAFHSSSGPSKLAVALDSGEVSTDPITYAKWVVEGKSRPMAAPWKSDIGEKPQFQRLLVVSAGGIGGNFCHILRDSYFHTNSAFIVDPDHFDISNLNRAIGVGLNNVLARLPKASFAADAVNLCANDITAVQASYESWMTADLASQFRQPDTAVIVGVDQVRTRLAVGSDWPSIFLNGGTSGVTFSTSTHLAVTGGCIGCWYGQAEATFAQTRTPLACAGGVAPGVEQVAQPFASYPFVSVAAAAKMVAMLIRMRYEHAQGTQCAGTVFSMNLHLPQEARVSRIDISERCLLLCSEAYLQSIIGRTSNV